MSFDLDHLFILTEPEAPQAELLSSIGLLEGTPRRHPGQGTANRRFFFKNGMLELLYICDRAEAIHGAGKPLRLVDRLQGKHASRFGIVVKSRPESVLNEIPCWDYHPPYLPAGQCFLVGNNSDALEEPLCIIAPMLLPSMPTQPKQVSSFGELTELHLSVPVATASRPLSLMTQCSLIKLHFSEPHLMEVVFNDKERGSSADLRPHLPLIIHW
jgi:hypothetical protein